MHRRLQKQLQLQQRQRQRLPRELLLLMLLTRMRLLWGEEEEEHHPLSPPIQLPRLLITLLPPSSRLQGRPPSEGKRRRRPQPRQRGVQGMVQSEETTTIMTTDTMTSTRNLEDRLVTLQSTIVETTTLSPRGVSMSPSSRPTSPTTALRYTGRR